MCSNVSAPPLATPRQTLGFIDRLPFLFCEKPISCLKKWQRCQMVTWKIFEHFCFYMFRQERNLCRNQSQQNFSPDGATYSGRNARKMPLLPELGNFFGLLQRCHTTALGQADFESTRTAGKCSNGSAGRWGASGIFPTIYFSS